MCGLEIDKNIQTTFKRSKSMLFSKNDGNIPLCNACLATYYGNVLMDFSGDHKLAVERMCQIFDWYFDEDVLEIALNSNGSKSMIETYLSKVNLSQYQKRGITYRDTVKNRHAKSQNLIQDFEIEYDDSSTPHSAKRKKNSNRSSFVTEEDIKFWGEMYNEEDIPFLNSIYDELVKVAESNGYDLSKNVSKSLAIKNLSLISFKLQKEIANDGKNISALTNSYMSMLKQAGLDQENEINTESDTFGTFLRDIQKYTPSEYYNEPDKYKDYFGQEDYINRFITRPLKNLFSGSKTKDKEFNIDNHVR